MLNMVYLSPDWYHQSIYFKEVIMGSVEEIRKIKEALAKQCGYSTKKLTDYSAKVAKKYHLKYSYPKHLLKKAA